MFAIILALHALINIYSSHLVALFNTISVWWHVIGVLIIIGILIIVPDSHQSADFVFTERINNSGFDAGSITGGLYWFLVLPVGFLLTMYTITGYDASAHVAEETVGAEQAAAKGIWQSVASSALIGWFVLLAITFAATNVGRRITALRDLHGGLHLRRHEPELGRGDHPDRGGRPILLRPGLRDELSRTFFAFSRDRAVPGWKLWSRVSGKRGVPLAAVACSCALVFLLMVPALPGKGTYVPPVAFFAATAIGTVGLYIAYVAPVFLRWRQGDAFQPRSWTLGPRYKWINPIAVLFVIFMVIVLCLPAYSTGVPWESDFDWSLFNYTPLVVGLVVLGAGLAWVLGANKRYKGPIRQLEFDEGLGTAAEEPGPAAGGPPPAPAASRGGYRG